MKETGNPLDLMIDGQAMFAVQETARSDIPAKADSMYPRTSVIRTTCCWSIHKAILC